MNLYGVMIWVFIYEQGGPAYIRIGYIVYIFWK